MTTLILFLKTHITLLSINNQRLHIKPSSRNSIHLKKYYLARNMLSSLITLLYDSVNNTMFFLGFTWNSVRKWSRHRPRTDTRVLRTGVARATASGPRSLARKWKFQTETYILWWGDCQESAASCLGSFLRCGYKTGIFGARCSKSRRGAVPWAFRFREGDVNTVSGARRHLRELALRTVPASDWP